MRIQGEQKYVLLAGMTGFLLGICSANLWMKQYVLDIGILNQYFLEQYNQADIVYEAYLWYLVKSRGTPFVLLLAAAGTRYRKMAVMLTVVWLGFCFGMVICMAIIKLGSKGIVHIVTALAPGNLLCNGRDRVIPLYAGISNGEMGCGKKYPSWPVPDAGDHYRVLCKSGTYRLVFEDTVNIQKCRIKEPIHEKICFISCIGSFFVQKIS